MGRAGMISRNYPLYKRDVRDDIDDRGTPQWLFDALNKEHQFTVDAAAAPHNAKCERYWTIDDDGLSQPWTNERVWCNPPYSNLRPWIEKAWEQDFQVAVLLLPADRTEQPWWQELVEPHRDRHEGFRTQFLDGRLRFTRPVEHPTLDGTIGMETMGSPPFGCVLLRWSP